MSFFMLQRTRMSTGVVSFLLLASAACSDGGGKPAQMPGVGNEGGQGGETVTNPPPPASEERTPPPLSGGTLAVLADGRTAVASDPDRDRLYIVDLAGKKVRATINLQPGDEPGRHVQDADGRVHVALRGGGAVATIDPVTGTVLGRRSLCAAPRGLAFDAEQNLLHVACAGGELVSIGTMAASPTRSLMIERDLRDVVVKGHSLLVSTFKSSQLLVVGADGQIGTRLSPSARPAASLGFGGRGVKIDPVFGAVEGKASPGVAWRMIAAPGGKALMVHQRATDVPLQEQPGGYVSAGCTGFVEGGITEYDPEQPVEAARVRSGAALASVVLPIDMAVSPDGKQIAMVTAGNRNMQVQFVAMDEATTDKQGGDPCVFPSPVPAPLEGDKMEPPPADDEALPAPVEYRPANGEVIAVAYDKRGNVLVQSREPATLQILTQRADAITLSTDSKLDQGHQMFHAATKGLLACASCHPEGGDDGRVWNFSQVGPRRTQSLRGGIMDTAPFHWNGDLRNLGHLMNEVFESRMQGPHADDARVDSLSRFIDKIPTIKISAWRDPQAIERGRKLFASAEVGCTKCHGGADMTDNRSVDVGTGGLFQTPQLHGLAFRGPFMHDGCARTLADRFGRCGGGDKHGTTSMLTADQVNDLVSYLETL